MQFSSYIAQPSAASGVRKVRESATCTAELLWVRSVAEALTFAGHGLLLLLLQLQLPAPLSLPGLPIFTIIICL